MKIRNFSQLFTSALALGATLLLAPNVLAVDEKSKLNGSDVRFIQDEAAAGATLVALAELGATKAKHEEVQAFAAKLVSDHTKANAELQSLASRKGVELSPKTDAKYRNKLEKLEESSRADFDKEFLSMIASRHEKCVENYEEAATEVKDRDVKAWAAKMLPALQIHQDKAEQLSSLIESKERATSINTSSKQPDNTDRNKRDRDLNTLTPLDQGNSKSDIDTTAQIRREILDLDDLSANAKNVKIITNEGRVTLRGPVNSAEEKRILGEIAARIATSGQIDNQLEVRSTASIN